MKTVRENLLNEYKGYIFEFLVAQELAKKFGIESNFLASIPHTLLNQLSGYEAQVRNLDPELIKKLPVLSTILTNRLILNLPGISGVKMDTIQLLGKLAGNWIRQIWGETDLKLMDIAGHEYNISLKLAKAGAWLNTKSGGSRSFFTTYFAAHPKAELRQNILNLKMDEHFKNMCRNLHQLFNLPQSDDFQTYWIPANLPELPGPLSKEAKIVLHEYYHNAISEFYQAFQYFHQEDLPAFKSSLIPLCGMGGQDIIQACCFYKDRYEIEKIHIFTKVQLKEELKTVRLGQLVPGKSSFEIHLKHQKLQIRVKPMNTFTQPSLKLNCSVQFAAEQYS